MKYTIDARGLQCPLPVVKAKQQLQDCIDEDIVEVIVDNQIAVENLTKFANVRSYNINSIEKDHDYYVYISKGENCCEIMPTELNNEVIYITTKYMGVGDDVLGAKLMNAYIFSITKQDRFPSKMIFANGGAFLTCSDSECLEDLKFLESQGVEINTCGTCLDFYNLKDKLAIGSVSNMYDIVESLEFASKVVHI